uniref:UPAR/Ly6 domain-containing protein n=1 Tax=Steinernema glaseri TaxID=37863 RepID=A0A1I7YZM7_9BILA
MTLILLFLVFALFVRPVETLTCFCISSPFDQQNCTNNTKITMCDAEEGFVCSSVYYIDGNSTTLWGQNCKGVAPTSPTSVGPVCLESNVTGYLLRTCTCHSYLCNSIANIRITTTTTAPAAVTTTLKATTTTLSTPTTTKSAGRDDVLRILFGFLCVVVAIKIRSGVFGEKHPVRRDDAVKMLCASSGYLVRTCTCSTDLCNQFPLNDMFKNTTTTAIAAADTVVTKDQKMLEATTISMPTTTKSAGRNDVLRILFGFLCVVLATIKT